MIAGEQGRRGVLLAAAGLACVVAGTWAGLDASAEVNPFYWNVPAWRPRAAVIVSAPPVRRAHWAETPVAAAPSPGLEEQAGPDERAFFDLGVAERGREEPIASVRIHRGSVREARIDVAGPDSPQAETGSRPDGGVAAAGIGSLTVETDGPA